MGESMMAQYFDPWTLRHLDQWLDRYVDGDDCRAEVKAAMLAYAADDSEYWPAQGWTNLFDRARADRIVTRYREFGE